MYKLVATLLFLLPAAAHAAEVTTQLPGCEFSLKLPENPTIKTGRAGGGAAKGPSMVATLRNRVPAYRVECQGFTRLPPNARNAMLDDAEKQAQDLNLADFRSAASDTRLGVEFEYSGIEIQAGQRFVVSGRNILGQSSVFSLVITEPVRSYPSKESQRVLKSIRR